MRDGTRGRAAMGRRRGLFHPETSVLADLGPMTAFLCGVRKVSVLRPEVLADEGGMGRERTRMGMGLLEWIAARGAAFAFLIFFGRNAFS